jgi:hypothetical protein
VRIATLRNSWWRDPGKRFVPDVLADIILLVVDEIPSLDEMLSQVIHNWPSQ